MENRTAGNPIRSAAVTLSTNSARLGPLNTSGALIRLVASVDCYVTFGNSAVAAAAATGSLAEHTMFLPGGAVEYFASLPEEAYVAGIVASGSGVLYVTEIN